MDAAANLFFGEIGEEALDLVELRGRCRGVVDLPARSLSEPVADRLRLMAGHIVDDDVDIEIVRHTGLDRVEEGAELARPMSRKTAADDFAGRRIESGEQRQRAVPV